MSWIMRIMLYPLIRRRTLRHTNVLFQVMIITWTQQLTCVFMRPGNISHFSSFLPRSSLRLSASNR